MQFAWDLSRFVEYRRRILAHACEREIDKCSKKTSCFMGAFPMFPTVSVRRQLTGWKKNLLILILIAISIPSSSSKASQYPSLFQDFACCSSIFSASRSDRTGATHISGSAPKDRTLYDWDPGLVAAERQPSYRCWPRWEPGRM